jgi:hypothetical protein
VSEALEQILKPLAHAERQEFRRLLLKIHGDA